MYVLCIHVSFHVPIHEKSPLNTNVPWFLKIELFSTFKNMLACISVYFRFRIIRIYLRNLKKRETIYGYIHFKNQKRNNNFRVVLIENEVYTIYLEFKQIKLLTIYQ